MHLLNSKYIQFSNDEFIHIYNPHISKYTNKTTPPATSDVQIICYIPHLLTHLHENFHLSHVLRSTRSGLTVAHPKIEHLNTRNSHNVWLCISTLKCYLKSNLFSTIKLDKRLAYGKKTISTKQVLPFDRIM